MRAGLVLLTLVLLGGSAWATTATSANDAGGDERIVLHAPSPVHLLASSCDHAGADIVHFSVRTDVDHIEMNVGVASPDRRIRCATELGTAALFVPELRLESHNGTAPSFYLTIENATTCGHVEIPGAGSAKMCGDQHAQDGDAVSWRFPLQPTVTTPEGNVTLDLRGARFLYSAEVNAFGAIDPLGELRYTVWDGTRAIVYDAPEPEPEPAP